MDFKYFLEQQIEELFIKGKSKAENDDYIIAFKQNVWIINDDNFDDYLDEIKKELKISNDINDINDLEQYVNEEAPDVIIGVLNDRTLTIRTSNWRQQSSSDLIKKVAKLLNFDNIEIAYYDNATEDDDYVNIKIGEENFYHGTSLSAYNKMKTGLRPTGTTNFDKIVHTDKIFVTMNIEKALFHAYTAADKQESMPIIIELKIPDKDKLIVDYDVAIDMIGNENEEINNLGYTDIHFNSGNGNIKKTSLSDILNRQELSPLNLSNRLGVFGYQGRIPASFFESIIFDNNALYSYIISNELGMEVGEIKYEPLKYWDNYNITEFEQHVKEVTQDIYDEYNEEE